MRACNDSDWILHTRETAPAPSHDSLEAVEKAHGFVPNLYKALAVSPFAVNAYFQLNEIAAEFSTFSVVERQFILLGMSAENQCDYCVPAHRVVARASGASLQDLAVAAATDTANAPRLAALNTYSRAVIRERGRVSQADTLAFLDAGFTPARQLKIVTFAAIKTLSNYAAHLLRPPLDPEFESP